MSPDYPLLAALAQALDTRMIVFRAGSEIIATLDGEPHDTGSMSCLPNGFCKLVPHPVATLGELVSIPDAVAIDALHRLGMIEAETRH